MEATTKTLDDEHWYMTSVCNNTEHIRNYPQIIYESQIYLTAHRIKCVVYVVRCIMVLARSCSNNNIMTKTSHLKFSVIINYSIDF